MIKSIYISSNKKYEVVIINKLQGFRTLRELGIPSTPWAFMDENTELSEGILWTVRTAVEVGDDYNLPRAVGVNAEVAKQKYEEFSKEGLKVICYPYFVAEISGVVIIEPDKIVIEYVNSDLWDLVTKGKVDGRQILPINTWCEYRSIVRYAKWVYSKMKGYIENNLSIYLEWSWASNCDINKNKTGKPYLVFYECRVIK